MTRTDRSPLCSAKTCRPGMSLIELLVVVAILGLLAVTVVPNIAGTLDRRRFREAARGLSTFIARAQSRAISSKEPKGFLMQPIAGDPHVALDFFFADTPDAYAGEFASTTVVVTPSSDSHDGGLVFSDSDTVDRLRGGFCRTGDAIQFGGDGPYFQFVNPNPDRPRIDTEFAVSMWEGSNQTPYNTVLPASTASGKPFRIRRQPTRASSGLLQLSFGAAIDLRWSTLGSVFVGDLLTAPSAPIVVLFDSAGRPDELVHSNGQRLKLGVPIFLLLGLAELCGNQPVALDAGGSTAEPAARNGANWQYVDAVWICIDHQSGLVRLAPVDAKRANEHSGTPEEKAILSQWNARAAIGVGLGSR